MPPPREGGSGGPKRQVESQRPCSVLLKCPGASGRVAIQVLGPGPSSYGDRFPQVVTDLSRGRGALYAQGVRTSPYPSTTRFPQGRDARSSTVSVATGRGPGTHPGSVPGRGRHGTGKQSARARLSPCTVLTPSKATMADLPSRPLARARTPPGTVRGPSAYPSTPRPWGVPTPSRCCPLDGCWTPSGRGCGRVLDGVWTPGSNPAEPRREPGTYPAEGRNPCITSKISAGCSPVLRRVQTGQLPGLRRQDGRPKDPVCQGLEPGQAILRVGHCPDSVLATVSTYRALSCLLSYLA
jgi:hypothetical protein